MHYIKDANSIKTYAKETSKLWMFHPHIIFSKDTSNLLSFVKFRPYFKNIIQNVLLYLHLTKKKKKKKKNDHNLIFKQFAKVTQI